MEITKLQPAFVDERGSIWDLLSDDTIHHSGYLISKKNSIRGKHFHKQQKQYTLLLKGVMEISIKNLKDPQSSLEKYVLHPFEMILIPPLHYHSLLSLIIQIVYQRILRMTNLNEINLIMTLS